MNQQTGCDLHRMVDVKKASEWAIEHSDSDRQSNEQPLSGHRKEGRLVRSCTALMRILGTDCLDLAFEKYTWMVRSMPHDVLPTLFK